MSEWEEKILEDLVYIDPEQLPPSTDADYSFCYIDISSVSPGNISYPVHEIKFKDSPSRARKIVKDNDILMSTVRPNLKAFALFREKRKKIFIASTGFAVLRSKPNVDISYIYHFLFSNKLEKQIETFVVGSNYPAINTSNVRNLIINIPTTFQGQRVIANILTTCDSVIEKTQLTIAKYKSIKQGLLHNLFVRGLDAHCHLRPTFEQAPEFYKNSILGMIPKEWEVRSLFDCCNNTCSYGINAAAVDFESYLPLYLRITDITDDGQFNKANRKCVNDPQSDNYVLKENEIVFARTGATVGKTYLYDPDDGKLIYAGFLIKFSPDSDELNSYFLKSFTETSNYWKWVNIYSQRSGQPGINGNEFGSLKLPVPKIEEQNEIAKRLKSIDLQIQSELMILIKYRSIKNGLMHDLLSGKKEVKVTQNE